MRKLMLLAALTVLATPMIASAFNPKTDQYGFRKRNAPRAAPWFLYWPYGAYWQTPAPTGFYGGNGPMTVGPAASQIGRYNMPTYPTYPGPTGYDY